MNRSGLSTTRSRMILTRSSAKRDGAPAVRASIHFQLNGQPALPHADSESAARALATVQVAWRLPEARPEPDSIFDHLVAKSVGPAEVASRGGIIDGKSGWTQMIQGAACGVISASAPSTTSW